MMHVASPLSTNRHNIPKDTSTFIVFTVDKHDDEYSMVWHCTVSLIGTGCLAWISQQYMAVPGDHQNGCQIWPKQTESHSNINTDRTWDASKSARCDLWLAAYRFQQPKTFSDIRNLRRRKSASDLTFFEQINRTSPLTGTR
jgi:hypothetical protein